MHEEKKASLASFAAHVRAAFAAAPKEAWELANTVTVQPGGKTFPTITAAMNSITDSSIRKQYTVQVGPGTYNEMVVCKPYVFIGGAGVVATTVTAKAATEESNQGTIKAASNSAVQNMTINSESADFVNFASAVACVAAQNFDIENCTLAAYVTTTKGGNVSALIVDDGPGAGGSQVNVAYTEISAHGPSDAGVVGLEVHNKAYVHVMDSKILAENSPQTFGAMAYDSAIELYGSAIVGATYALLLQNDEAHITATECRIVGPVSPGVVIKP